MNEENLKAAAVELESALLDVLPDGEESDHEFSDSFDRKMKKILFFANHPIVGSGWRRAVAAVLTVVFLGGSVVMAVPKARASFVGWVKEVYGSAMHYFVPESATGDHPVEIPAAYHLGWVPEGYALVRILESVTNVTYIYGNANGHLLYFDYIIPKKNASADCLFEVKDHTHKVVFVGDLQADLYINSNKERSNLLVWLNEDGTVLFSIMGILEEEVLIKLAEDILPGMIE